MGALFTGAAGAGLGALAGPLLARLILRLPGGPRWSPTKGDIGAIRRRAAIMGGLLGALPWLPFAFQKESGEMEKIAQPRFVSLAPALEIIEQDRFLEPGHKTRLKSIFMGAAQSASLPSSPTGKLHGLLTTGDLVSGAVGAGLGLTGGLAAGSALTAIFGLPTTSIRKMSLTGALAGLLLGTGVIG